MVKSNLHGIPIICTQHVDKIINEVPKRYIYYDQGKAIEIVDHIFNKNRITSDCNHSAFRVISIISKKIRSRSNPYFYMTFWRN